MASITVPVSSIGRIPTNIRAQPTTTDPFIRRATPESSTYSGRIIYSKQGNPLYLLTASGDKVPIDPRFSARPEGEKQPIGNNLSRPGDGKYTGVNGPATYYNTHQQQTGAPSASDNLDALLEAIQNGEEGLTTASGQLTEAAQAQLVAGLNIDQVREIEGLLDPTAMITFDLVEFEGATLYVNARLTTAELAEQQDKGNLGMNYPTAHQYLENGNPIARAAWAGEFDELPKRWLTKQGVIVSDNRETGRLNWTQGESATLTEADLRAQDWVTSPGVTEIFPEQADFPGGVTETETPTFDVHAPPVNVAA